MPCYDSRCKVCNQEVDNVNSEIKKRLHLVTRLLHEVCNNINAFRILKHNNVSPNFFMSRELFLWYYNHQRFNEERKKED